MKPKGHRTKKKEALAVTLGNGIQQCCSLLHHDADLMLHGTAGEAVSVPVVEKR
jgi:hypothetical protein